MNTSTLSLPGCTITASAAWRDITDTLETDTRPFTLAKEHGVSALQFSAAQYRVGPLPNATLQDLAGMLADFAASHGFGEGFNRRATMSPNCIVAASFQSDDDLIRAWYVSDGRHFMFITYVCAWESRDVEVAECEAIVESICLDS